MPYEIPQINDLKNPDKYQLIKIIKHNQIIEFVIENITRWNILSVGFMAAHIILAGGFIFDLVVSWSNIGFWKLSLSFILSMLFFFPLIIIHEWLHLFSMKYYGAQKTHLAIVPEKFMVYAYAENFVSRKNDYIAIALGPFIVINTLLIMLLFVANPFFRMIVWMSLFLHFNGCTGDIAIVNFLLKFKNTEVYSYDDHQLKESYFFTSNTDYKKSDN